MLISERQDVIIELIRKNGSVQVEKLAKELNVSNMTIRRDLERLSASGIVERCHGGAVAKKEVTYENKRISHHKEKEQLAFKCLSLVQPGDTVYLDAGTTIYEIARRIGDLKELMVVTNDLEIARYLMRTEVELILCGGYVQKSTGSMLGYYASQMMENFRFDVGFFGAASIDEQLNVLTPTIDKSFLKRQMVGSCLKSYLAVDSSKFNKRAMTKILNLADFTGIITDHAFSAEEQLLIKAKKINLL